MNPQDTIPQTPVASEVPAASIPAPETYTPAPGEPLLGKAAPHSMPTEKKSSGVGPMVGAIIVIAILIAGALYFFGSNGMLPMIQSIMSGQQDTNTQEAPMTSAPSADVDAQASAAAADLGTLDTDLDTAIKDLDANL